MKSKESNNLNDMMISFKPNNNVLDTSEKLKFKCKGPTLSIKSHANQAPKVMQVMSHRSEKQKVVNFRHFSLFEPVWWTL
jgi:hypothetical protein